MCAGVSRETCAILCEYTRPDVLTFTGVNQGHGSQEVEKEPRFRTKKGY
jgi:hypothetical protein